MMCHCRQVGISVQLYRSVSCLRSAVFKYIDSNLKVRSLMLSVRKSENIIKVSEQLLAQNVPHALGPHVHHLKLSFIVIISYNITWDFLSKIRNFCKLLLYELQYLQYHSNTFIYLMLAFVSLISYLLSLILSLILSIISWFKFGSNPNYNSCGVPGKVPQYQLK